MKRSRKTSAALLALVMVLAAFGSACTVKYPKGKEKALTDTSVYQKRTPIYEHEGWTIARATLHNHTVYSDGSRTPEDLLDQAEAEGIAILAYNDHREGTVCIGRSLCVIAGGVERYGYDVYYEHLAKIQEVALERGMIVTRGIEVSPPYMYNAGKFPNMVLAGQFNHFTVYNIHDPEILENMPVRNKMTWKPETDPGDKPFQDFVSYIHEKGGIVHSVHPESPQDDWVGGIHVTTPRPVWNIHLKDLQGFAILPEGNERRTGAPGGLWDSALIEYMAGMRDMPLWASADADFHGPEGSLTAATTLMYMREFTEKEVYNCMREGRMVALQGEDFQDVYVSEWFVSGEGGPKDPVMLGEEVTLSEAPVVKFSLSKDIPGTKITLIRNGVVIHEVEGSEMIYTDDEQGGKKEPAYYRVQVDGPVKPGKEYKPYDDPMNVLLVNPIFVRF